MDIEVLYVSDCPNHIPVVRALIEILDECRLQEHIRQVEVTDSDQAIALSFPGSPTIRVNGADIENNLSQGQTNGPACRTYMVGGKPQGVPPREWMRDAIMKAASLEKESPDA